MKRNLFLVPVLMIGIGYWIYSRTATELWNNAVDVLNVDIVAEYVRENQKLPENWEAFLEYNRSHGSRFKSDATALETKLKLKWGLSYDRIKEKPTLVWRNSKDGWIPDTDLTQRLKDLGDQEN